MRAGVPLWPLGLLALWLGAGCVTPVAEPLGPVPRYYRADGAFDALDLDRDVVACADRAREHVAAEFTDWRAPPEVPRLDLRNRTSDCMSWKGWSVERALLAEPE